MRDDWTYESELQRKAIERLERIGGKQDEEIYYIVWLFGRCLLVNSIGDVCEL